MSQPEDNPPLTPSVPVPDEYTETSQRRTTMLPGEADAHMVALSLSSMATTLEAIQAPLSTLPSLTLAIQGLQTGMEELRGTVNLAGGMAAAAQETAAEAVQIAGGIRSIVERLESAVGKLALSVQGLDHANRSIIAKVFPIREEDSGPDIEMGEPRPLRRVMTGE